MGGGGNLQIKMYFCASETQEKIANTGKRQGISL